MAPTAESCAVTLSAVVPSPPCTTGWKKFVGAPDEGSVTATTSESLGTTGTEGTVTPETLLMLAVPVGTALGGPTLRAAVDAAPTAGALADERMPSWVQLMPSGLP